MPVEMVRIDDRLIHGQVVVGWCPVINPDCLILCDDEIAGSEWQCQLYRDAAADYETLVCSVKQTVELLKGEQLKNQRVFIVVNSPATVVQLLDGGAEFNKVIVGGLHFQSGKRRVTDFIYIDDRDLTHFQMLVNRAITLEGRDVPTCNPIDIPALLGLKKN
jgi:mannose/fructose/N-acetylgalactosamine-specific phosphotransferase system component IIB